MGVDIGTTSIKMVELDRTPSSLRLKNYGILESYGHLDRLNDAIQTSSLKLFERETIELLKLLLGRVKPSSRRVIASIPSFASFVTLLEMPEMSAEETAKTMPFQVRQYIPIPVSEVAIDWLRVGERQNEQGGKIQQVLLVSVPNEQIVRYRQVFKAAGLDLVALEIEGLSLVRVLVDGDPTPSLILDIGSRSTNILVVDEGNLKLVQHTDFAGGTLTQAISSGLNIDPHRAEELKKARGLLGSGGEYELSTLMLPYIDVILQEAERLKQRYEMQYNGRIERLLLTGGSASLLGLDAHCERQMKLPVVKANPFAKISYPNGVDPLISELGASFAVSLGLAVRGIV